METKKKKKERRRIATSVKKEFTESTSWQMWRRAMVLGTGCPLKSFIQFYIPSSLCGELTDHIYICGRKIYHWIPIGLRCFPHDLHSAPHISPIPTLHPLLSRTHPLAWHNRTLVPTAALRHCCSHSNRGKSCPLSYSEFYSRSNCGRKKKLSWCLSSLPSCEPAGILTLLVSASSFPHSSPFFQHLQFH